MSRNYTFAAVAAALALAGCGQQAGLNTADFGGAVDNNLVSQAAYSFAEQRLVAMSTKFRAAAPDTVTFDFNSSTLDAEARRVLDIQAIWLNAHPDVRMRVTGHADAVGSAGYNTRIGLMRARAVVRYLNAKGVARTRLDAVESLGESQLVVQTLGPERRNRRTVTDVAGFAQGFVGHGMNGRRAAAAYNAYVSDSVDTVTIESTGG